MGWFRGQRRLGAWLALVALALQLGLGFGHIHVEAPDHAPGLAATAAEGPQGSHHDHGDTADRNYCPCCAILSLLAGARTGEMSPPAMPVWQTAEEIIPAAETTRPGSTRAAFRARAPPLA
jgi:hypothetical protein